MSGSQEQTFNYIWRCAKCSNHLANISKADGFVRLEKKCPKCKSINILSLNSKDILIQCKLFDRSTNNYIEKIPENYPYEEL